MPPPHAPTWELARGRGWECGDTPSPEVGRARPPQRLPEAAGPLVLEAPSHPFLRSTAVTTAGGELALAFRVPGAPGWGSGQQPTTPSGLCGPWAPSMRAPHQGSWWGSGWRGARPLRVPPAPDVPSQPPLPAPPIQVLPWCSGSRAGDYTLVHRPQATVLRAQHTRACAQGPGVVPPTRAQRRLVVRLQRLASCWN